MAAFIHLYLAKDSGAPLIPSTSSVALYTLNTTSTHSSDQLFLKFFKLHISRKKLSAPDQSFSSYKALLAAKKFRNSTVASNIRPFRWITMSFASPVSPNLSSWSKVIIMRQEWFQRSRRKSSEIYLPIGAFVWPCSRHKSAASCCCERRFNLIKSRLMARLLASLELQHRLSEGKKAPLQNLPLSCYW